MSKVNKLQNKVVVVGDTKKKPTLKKTDRDAVRIVDAAVNGNGAVESKKILIDPKSLKGIKSVESDWSEYKASMVSPYKRSPRGCGIIKVENLTEYQNKFREYTRLWEKEVDAYCDNYDEIISESRVRQGTNFDIGDLPVSRGDMRSRFEFEFVGPFALENPEDLSFALNDMEIDEIRKEVSDEIMESIKGSLSESYSRINELIEKLDKYDPDGPIGEKHGYHESALDNVRKAADALDNLNFTEHEGVSAIQKDMRDLLIGHTAESTKGNESSRKDVVEKAKGIVKKNFAAFGY